MRTKNHLGNTNANGAWESDNARKAHLWDAHEHYQDNQAGYYQAAVEEDARIHGGDVKTGPEIQQEHPIEKAHQ